MTSNEEFLAQVLERLSEADAGNDLVDVVLAACCGEAELEAWASGQPPERPDAVPADERVDPPGAYLKSLTVEGFRGIGPAATLTFTPGPGLHVVVGRNGSGKSSFAEAFELLLTGSSRRLEARAAAWREGWRNVHHPSPCWIEARVHVDGTEQDTVLRREWSDAAKNYNESTTAVQLYGKPKADLSAVGWDVAVQSYRPMLAAVDFEDVVGKPSELYEKLAGVLGLDDYNAARARLDRFAKELKAEVEAPQKELQPLITRLRDSADPRAAECVAALDTGRKPCDLDAAEAIAVTGEATEGIATLRAIAALQAPAVDDVLNAAARLREAAHRVESLQSEAVSAATDVLALVESALRLHDQHGDQPCPVCGVGSLDSHWHERAQQQRDRLQAETDELMRAKDQLALAFAGARQLVAPVPACLTTSVDDLDLTRVHDLWTAWSALPVGDDLTTAVAVADHLESRVRELGDAINGIAKEASKRLASLDAEWRPLARDVAAWIKQARAAAEKRPKHDLIRRANQWLADEIERLRTQRFAPLASDAQMIWDQLRCHSNVSLEDVQLAGDGTRRRVEVAVRVDDADAGLGVLSQGEVNALALSMFIPRATRAQSPFRFLIIDDPVQAMDPAKVDGLAKVLSDLAQSRQVIVLTHDDRLPNAIRRMGIPGRIIELVRAESSVVTPHDVMSPAINALRSARA
ncbi:MAG TPA: AAA family ATPase, partial [Acidimicrobiales bacterium]